jgi:hypothetical protein
MVRKGTTIGIALAMDSILSRDMLPHVVVTSDLVIWHDLQMKANYKSDNYYQRKVGH